MITHAQKPMCQNFASEALVAVSDAAGVAEALGMRRGWNYNVFLTFAFRISDGIATGVWSSSVLSNFIFTSQGEEEGNKRVGIAQAVQGTFLVAAAIPAAWLASHVRRDAILRVLGVVALCAILSTATSLWHYEGDAQYYRLCVSLALWGVAQANAPVLDALFADSVPTGRRTALYTLLHIGYILSQGLGPAVAALLFYVYGNEWSAERLRVVMLAGIALAVVPALLLLMFDDDKALGQESEGLLKVLSDASLAASANKAADRGAGRQVVPPERQPLLGDDDRAHSHNNAAVNRGLGFAASAALGPGGEATCESDQSDESSETDSNEEQEDTDTEGLEDWEGSSSGRDGEPYNPDTYLGAACIAQREQVLAHADHGHSALSRRSSSSGSYEPPTQPHHHTVTHFPATTQHAMDAPTPGPRAAAPAQHSGLHDGGAGAAVQGSQSGSHTACTGDSGVSPVSTPHDSPGAGAQDLSAVPRPDPTSHAIVFSDTSGSARSSPSPMPMQHHAPDPTSAPAATSTTGSPARGSSRPRAMSRLSQLSDPQAHTTTSVGPDVVGTSSDRQLEVVEGTLASSPFNMVVGQQTGQAPGDAQGTGQQSKRVRQGMLSPLLEAAELRTRSGELPALTAWQAGTSSGLTDPQDSGGLSQHIHSKSLRNSSLVAASVTSLGEWLLPGTSLSSAPSHTSDVLHLTATSTLGPRESASSDGGAGAHGAIATRGSSADEGGTVGLQRETLSASVSGASLTFASLPSVPGTSIPSIRSTIGTPGGGAGDMAPGGDGGHREHPDDGARPGVLLCGSPEGSQGGSPSHSAPPTLSRGITARVPSRKFHQGPALAASDAASHIDFPTAAQDGRAGVAPGGAGEGGQQGSSVQGERAHALPMWPWGHQQAGAVAGSSVGSESVWASRSTSAAGYSVAGTGTGGEMEEGEGRRRGPRSSHGGDIEAQMGPEQRLLALQQLHQGRSFLCLGVAAIPGILAVTDCIMGLASGMTIKFFPVWFREAVGLTPVYVSLIYTLVPLCLSAAAALAQRQSRAIGKVPTMVVNRAIGIALLYWIAIHEEYWTQGALMVPIYVIRTSIMNANYPLQRALLMDYVPKEHRAKWNSLESVTSFGWSGSAAVGGWLISSYGYQLTFLITATLQLLGWACSISLVPLVPWRDVSVGAHSGHSQNSSQHTSPKPRRLSSGRGKRSVRRRARQRVRG